MANPYQPPTEPTPATKRRNWLQVVEWGLFLYAGTSLWAAANNVTIRASWLLSLLVAGALMIASKRSVRGPKNDNRG
ncbi:hypothetical protein U8335_20375 [Roseiconus lacunae]|uniref:hypothetical protein n=1 Tax=Roseiconus lacunae TaxID=2605694 RepID=UPI0030938384|nr:hypothetical protein U8335_20375 [Stieleria sp. HD01]